MAITGIADALVHIAASDAKPLIADPCFKIVAKRRGRIDSAASVTPQPIASRGAALALRVLSYRHRVSESNNPSPSGRLADIDSHQNTHGQKRLKKTNCLPALRGNVNGLFRCCDERCAPVESVDQSIRGLIAVLASAWLFMALFLSLSAHAQSSDVQSANVVVNGEVLFPVRGVSAFPADQRARQIAEQIVARARDESFSPEALTIRSTSWGTEIDARGHRLFTIVDADVALQGPGIERRVLAETYKQRIAEVIRDYRRDRTPRVLLVNLGRALLVLALLAGVLFGLVRGFRWLEAILERRFKHRLVALESRSIGSLILQAEQVWQLLRTTLKLIRALLSVLAAYILINIVLSLFPWTRQLSLLLLDYLITPLIKVGTAMLDYIPSLVFLVVLVWIARYAIRITRLFFAAVANQRLRLEWFEAEWAWPTYRIVRAVLILVAIILAYPYIPGSGSDAFKGVSILIGVLFSLGSTSVIANIIAGYTMTYRRAFRVGDRIRIEQTVGDVTDIRVLVTHLRSLKNEEVILPNSKILN